MSVNCSQLVAKGIQYNSPATKNRGGGNCYCSSLIQPPSIDETCNFFLGVTGQGVGCKLKLSILADEEMQALCQEYRNPEACVLG